MYPIRWACVRLSIDEPRTRARTHAPEQLYTWSTISNRSCKVHIVRKWDKIYAIIIAIISDFDAINVLDILFTIKKWASAQ